MNKADEKPPSLFQASDSGDRSSNAERQLIGIIGMLLPVLLWLISGVRPIQGIDAWTPLGSISAYYYTGAVSAFTGGLIVLAVNLFAYWGYDNEYGVRDRIAAVIAGIAAVLVAFFPTGVPGDLSAPPWWKPPVGVIHYGAALVLFFSFMFFCLFQFPKTNPGNQKLAWDKQLRNFIYRFCGAAIGICLLWVYIAMKNGAPIFWPESLALEFFAVSWLVKGRADVTIKAAPQVAAHYGRHPRQLVNKALGIGRGKPQVGSRSPKKPR
jgi:hypothetical protein